MTAPKSSSRARRIAPAVFVVTALLASATLAAAHDMFVKPTRFFAPENAEVRVRLLNGTFSKSENSIARNRLADASVLTPRGRIKLDTAEWGVKGDTSTFHIHTRAAGTYVIGVSTKPNWIDLSADDFNLYLQDDGIPDVLEDRKKAGELNKPAKERYHKHVKSFVQVGTARSDLYATPMGYPAEIMAMVNPYTLKAGATLQVKTLVDGKPAGNQYVLFGGEIPGKGGIEQKSTRSNAQGIASIPLTTAGVWYIKFINMTKVTRDSVDYESKWATLTFEVR
ncbi:MAG: DUF4198 domain-containing protein [Gemmatimonadaceae bacterium]|nr:DUF4198 domain-containing protein [Gemmatimonadaceae bacterium]